MYISALDGLRGIAVVLVMLSHANRDIAQSGWVGVEIFFILSGYLITASLQQYNYKVFYIRRIARIFPALFLFMLLYCISSFYLNIQNDNNLLRSIFLFYSNWLFAFHLVNNLYLTHLWSLSVEEQFYLIFPWFFLLINKRNKLLLILFIFLFLYKIHFILLGDFQRFYYGTDTRASSFLLGSLIYFFSKEIDFEYYFSCSVQQILSTVALLTIFIISFFDFGSDVFVWLLLSNVCMILIMIFIENEMLFINNFLSNKVLVWIGKLSFSLYLFHGFIFSYLRCDLNFSMINILLIGTPVVVFLSILSFFYIERPVVEYSRKMSNR